MKTSKKLIIFFLIINTVLVPNLKAHACKAVLDAYRASMEGYHRFPWEVVALGSIYSTTAGQYCLYNVIHDIPKLNKWGEISKFEEKVVFNNNKDLQNYLTSRNLTNIVFAANNPESNEKLVSLFKSKVSKSENLYNEKTFFVENQDLKNNALHLHYIKIPDEFAKTKQKLVAETTLIYKNPDKNTKLDFGIFKSARLRRLEGIADKNLTKVSDIKENNGICVIQKEFKINSTDKSFVLTVFSPQSKIKKELEKAPNCCGKYIALVKIRAVEN